MPLLHCIIMLFCNYLYNFILYLMPLWEIATDIITDVNEQAASLRHTHI